MATPLLKLEESLADCTPAAVSISPSLRAWLQGDWALLFSDPDDFHIDDFESDRWLVVLRESFAKSGLRPLGLETRRSPRLASWVTETGGAYATASLEERQRSVGIFELNAGALRHAIRKSSSRFVMIIDESLRLRRTFVYMSQDALPSPLDFVAVASKLRKFP